LSNGRKFESVVTEFGPHLDRAEFCVGSATVTCTSEFGTKSTQAGVTPAKYVAERLLRELLQSAKQRGELEADTEQTT
jgi:hypothetical protein